MKICILTPRFPYPQWGGDTLRINEIAKYLKSRGHQLILVSLSDAKNPPLEDILLLYDKVHFVHRSSWQSIFFCLLYFITRRPMQCGYYHSGRYLRKLKEIVKNENPDLFICHLLRMAPYLEKLGVQDKSIVEMTDTLSKTYSIALSAKNAGLLKYVYSFEQRLIEDYELDVARKFRKVVLVSESDVNYLKSKVPDQSNHIYFHTNGVYIKENVHRKYDPNKIVFIGNMRYMPNQDAVIYFTKEVFPQILKEKPNATFHIVGSLPPDSIQSLASPHIIITGFIDNLEEYISDACVSVAPIRVAAGIQNKVLVAMSCRVPVVLSDLISHSITQLQHNQNCFVEDEPDRFAEACIDLMNNESLRNRIGEEGFKVVEDNYAWSKKLSGYECLE